MDETKTVRVYMNIADLLKEALVIDLENTSEEESQSLL